jgi:hypothetical protein
MVLVGKAARQREAADSGLLSPELAAGIRRVKGVRRLGVRVGNWLTAEQGNRLLARAGRDSLPGKRNYAILSMLIACGLRRGELLALHGASVIKCWQSDRNSSPWYSLRLNLRPSVLASTRSINHEESQLSQPAPSCLGKR